MCGRGVRSILLLTLVARCLETIDVCIWHMFVFVSVVVTVWGSVVECMYVVVNVMSLMSVMSPPCLVQPIDAHGSEVMYFLCFCFGGEVGFLNCDYICMCVVNEQL